MGRIEIIPRTDYGFNGNSASITDVPLVTRIDSSDWVSGCLIVRLHAKSFTGTTATASVLVQNVSYAADEPNIAFVDTTNVLATATIANGDTAPRLYVVPFGVSTTVAIGHMVRVLLRWTQGTSLGASTFSMSVELVARNA